MNLVGLFLAILCFDCVSVFYVFQFLLESTFSVETGGRLQGQLNGILRIQPNLTRTTYFRNVF